MHDNTSRILLNDTSYPHFITDVYECSSPSLDIKIWCLPLNIMTGGSHSLFAAQTGLWKDSYYWSPSLRHFRKHLLAYCLWGNKIPMLDMHRKKGILVFDFFYKFMRKFCTS